jgi:hypothetical protein
MTLAQVYGRMEGSSAQDLQQIGKALAHLVAHTRANHERLLGPAEDDLKMRFIVPLYTERELAPV